MESQQYFDFFDNIDEFSGIELKDKIYDFTKGFNINFLISLIDEFNDFYLKKWGNYLSLLSPEEEKELEPDGIISLRIIRFFSYQLYQNILIEVYYPYKWKSYDFDLVNVSSLYGYGFTKLMTNLIVQSCIESKIELRLIQQNCIAYQVDYKLLKEKGIDYSQEKLNTPKNRHNQIFKSNAFDVWSYLFNELNVKESSRTDVKFIFEEMKKEGIIHKSINQKLFLEWINDTYELLIEKTSNHSRSIHRIKAFNRAKALYIK